MATELRRVVFVLLPGTHPGCLMPALSVLLSANRMAEELCYQIECCTLDEQSMRAADGLLLQPSPSSSVHPASPSCGWWLNICRRPISCPTGWRHGCSNGSPRVC